VNYLLAGSNSSERWEALTFTGIVSGGGISPQYYHQKSYEFDYSISGGGSGYFPPQVNVTTFGTQASFVSNSTYWVDYSTRYSYPAILSGSDSNERWVSNSTSGTILSEDHVLARYQNQYFVTIDPLNNASGGTISPSSGWYNAMLEASLSASSDPGWKFVGWLGSGESSYTGNKSLATITVTSPVKEEAEFYPGVTISTGTDGSVTFSSQSHSGIIRGGSSTTIFVPPDSQIFLSASPSSVFELFSGWKGTINSGRQALPILVDAPESLNANFGFNYVIVITAVAAAIIVFSAVIFAIAKRKN
jgi:hypothetical protein